MVFDLPSLISAQVNASDVIILEGILVFHDQDVQDLMNMKIFVDTGLFYAKFVKPAFDDFVLLSKKYADVIVPQGGDNHVVAVTVPFFL
ncbi:hypothetical protein Ahy_B05g077617 isoform B [Arachis hypogaea]|uniref:Phosphoribulokinase/uridine kinase domain-containing protein n=1 Tax=Arachis hypogaea TaxID=3818 RepID=A0A444Z5K2_ARAHY|nr:hypothetical protein Ahy_B05g077617 isoform B [Arachis hypogaea]